MVQLLLTVNLILIVILFLLIVGNFLYLREFQEKVEEIEAEIIKLNSKSEENRIKIDRIREQISLLKISLRAPEEK